MFHIQLFQLIGTYIQVYTNSDTSEVGFQAVKNVLQISLPWYFPPCDVAQRETASAWIFRSLRMRLLGLYRNVEDRLGSDANFVPQNSRTSISVDSGQLASYVCQWLPHITNTGQHPAIYRRIQGSLTRHWEVNNYCRWEECMMNCWHNSYRNCSRLNI